ncbi:Multiple epidermal growth factor-like domains protein 8 [Podila minutissima]|nr:Multiple epidermal growth factor-like domains protein 8 [Podila minutissima]
MANTRSNTGRYCWRSDLSKSKLTLVLMAMALQGLTPIIHAQTSFPISVQAPSYSRTSTYMYILGGNSTGQVLGQFYKLDLAVPWKAAAPAWTRLADGPTQHLFPSTWSKDEKTLATFHVAKGVSVFLYSAATNTWAPSQLRLAHDDLQGVSAVTDPNTGLAYLAAGYMAMRDTMDVYNFQWDSMTAKALPPTIFQARSYYGNVWSRKRNSILYFGGYTASFQKLPDENIITEYVPSTSIWQTMVTFGMAPVMRVDHCMASNDDGTRVVIYGGRLADSTVSNDLFVLNTVTQSWSQGPSGPYRIYAACTIAGDLLVVWGGLDQTLNKVDKDMLVYNLTSNIWQSDYTPPASYVAARQAETAGSGSHVPGSIDTGAAASTEEPRVTCGYQGRRSASIATVSRGHATAAEARHRRK